MLHVVIEIFLWLLGLCVGSFLNVVIYRLEAGLSVADPVRSFCPRCRKGIAWYDNVPVLSWLLLRGRCRHCGGSISVQYPLVEAATGLAFVLVYHLLFVAGARAALPGTALPVDVPLLLAWLVLAAGLVGCAGLDIVSYTVDTRITNVLIVAGVILHAAWPRPAFFDATATCPSAAAAVAVLVASVVALWLTVWRREDEQPDDETDAAAQAEEQPATSTATRVGGCLGALALVGLAVWLICAAVIPAVGRLGVQQTPVIVSLVALFAAIVLAGGQRREADEEIRAAIEEERPQARRVAWAELKWLSPLIAAGVAVYLAVALIPALGGGWTCVVRWLPGGGFVPLGGIAVAAFGAVVGAAAGWVLRIVFTLVYGREAFGVGDIYILAAAGALAGWDIALLGLLLSVGIALAGWFIGLLLKRTVMIPFGPWLALGFLWALWWSRPAHGLAEHYSRGLDLAWEHRPELLFMAGGLMLVGSVAAVAFSRLVRRWVVDE